MHSSRALLQYFSSSIGDTSRVFAQEMHHGVGEGGVEREESVSKRPHANLLLQDGALLETCFNIHGLLGK